MRLGLRVGCFRVRVRESPNQDTVMLNMGLGLEFMFELGLVLRLVLGLLSGYG